MNHRWTNEQELFVRENYPICSQKELLIRFNKQFATDIKLTQLTSFIRNRKIRCGRTGRFEKGFTPFNKGTKGVTKGGIETQFKKGEKPHNYRPIGSERFEKDGTVRVKVSDEGTWQERWKPKHRHVWEQANGPVPEGYCVLFLDQNPRNAQLENLYLVKKSVITRLNKNKMLTNDVELNKTAILVASIQARLGELRKKE